MQESPKVIKVECDKCNGTGHITRSAARQMKTWNQALKSGKPVYRIDSLEIVTIDDDGFEHYEWANVSNSLAIDLGNDKFLYRDDYRLGVEWRHEFESDSVRLIKIS